MAEKILKWIPRIIATLFSASLMSFAFAELKGASLDMNKAIGFLLHSIPAFVVLMMLVVSWNWRVVGGLLFVTSFVVITEFYHTDQNQSLFISFSLPLILSGLFFLASGMFEFIVRHARRASRSESGRRGNGTSPEDDGIIAGKNISDGEKSDFKFNDK